MARSRPADAEPLLDDPAEAAAEVATEPEAEPTPAAPEPDLAGAGRAFLDALARLDPAQAAFHAALTAKQARASRPFLLDGRRFYPGRNGTIGEVTDLD